MLKLCYRFEHISGFFICSGYDIDIQLNEVTTTIADGKTHLHVDVDAEIGKDELINILKSIGLN